MRRNNEPERDVVGCRGGGGSGQHYHSPSLCLNVTARSGYSPEYNSAYHYRVQGSKQTSPPFLLYVAIMMP